MIDEADVKELERLERTVNGERGVSCVRRILFWLKEDDYESAQHVRALEGDKTRQYPEFEPVLYRMFGCRIHGVPDCEGWLCERKKPSSQ